MTPAAYFDKLAGSYDELWTESPSGRAQRNAVWRVVDPFVRQGARVLDYGCGTGEDALHFQQIGALIDIFDPSLAMLDIAHRKAPCSAGWQPAADWQSAPLKCLAHYTQAGYQPAAGCQPALHSYDLVFSNFGALNCVEDIAALRLETLVRPGGTLAICVMGRFCLWETAYYALRGQFAKAKRRWRGRAETSTGMRVYYPSTRELRFPGMRLIEDVGIGIAVPPSYVKGIPVRHLESIDKLIAKLGRAVGDHRLLLFVKSQ
jgi:SAM-dependent methyltransferase